MSYTIYDAILDTRRKCQMTDALSDNVRTIDEILHYIAEASAMVVGRMRYPVVQSFIPLEAGNTKQEFRLGEEAWVATQDDDNLDVTESEVKDANQRWTWGSVAPPVLNKNILTVQFRDSPTSEYITLEKYLESEIVDMGFDHTYDHRNSINSSFPMGWYLRDDFNELDANSGSLVVGIFPPPNPLSDDNMAVKVRYIPAEVFNPVLWGTYVPYEGYSATSVSGIKVKPSRDSSTVFFEGAESSGAYRAAADIVADIVGATYSFPLQGVEEGLYFGTVRDRGGNPRQWYRITAVKTIEDLDDYESSQSDYANYVVGFTISPAYAQLTGGSGSTGLLPAYPNTMGFVISGGLMVGQAFDYTLPRLVTNYAAMRMNESLGRLDQAEYWRSVFYREMKAAKGVRP